MSTQNVWISYLHEQCTISLLVGQWNLLHSVDNLGHHADHVAAAEEESN